MQITKASVATGGGKPTPEQLERINAMAKAELKADQVYVFSVRLCDDQIDRDQERFDTDALPVLAKLFVGKSGVVDHQWSAQKQIARIFATEVQRHDEVSFRFDTDALPVLAKLFVGKSGVVDHQWSAQKQIARIFATEVQRHDEVSFIKAWAYIRRGGAGDEWIADIEAGIKKEVSVGCAIFATEVQRHDEVSFIKAWAYIRRGGAGDEWIADIEAGIKKEVSVGCAMGRRVCSICGQSYGECGHEKGQVYDGQMCCAILREPMDAYEFSFVAVPAQPNAGVMKTMGAEKPSLKALAEHYGAQEEYRALAELAYEFSFVAVPAQPNAGVMKTMGAEKPSLKALAEHYGAQEEYRALAELARLGREHQKALADQVVGLCLALDAGVEEPVLRSCTGKLSAQELAAVQKALEKRAEERYPVRRQLAPRKHGDEVESGYLI